MSKILKDCGSSSIPTKVSFLKDLNKASPRTIMLSIFSPFQQLCFCRFLCKLSEDCLMMVRNARAQKDITELSNPADLPNIEEP